MEKYTISLIDGYFIEVDELNHTLKQTFMGKDKQGNVKASERTLGYFANTKECLSYLVMQEVKDQNTDNVLTLQEWLKEVERVLKQVKEIELGKEK